MQRAQEPNLGLWSPPGGKLHVAEGESPHGCAARETLEELGVRVAEQDFRLVGIISEVGYVAQAHWLMFLFELTTRLIETPPTHREGSFRYFTRQQLDSLA